MVLRVAVISLHTSPLLQPGTGDSGGMNVYVRELVSSLSQIGIECTTFTRADREGLPAEVFVEPGHRVVHIEAGPHHLPKEALPEISDQFCRGVMEWIAANEKPDIISSTNSTSRSYRRFTRSPESKRKAATLNPSGATGPRPRLFSVLMRSA